MCLGECDMADLRAQEHAQNFSLDKMWRQQCGPGFLVLVVLQENILTAVGFIPTTHCLQTRSQHWSRNLARPIGVKHGEIETRGEARVVRSNAMVFVYPRRMFVRRTIFLRPKQAIKLQFQVAALRDAFGEALYFFQEFPLHYLSPARSEKIRSNIAYRYCRHTTVSFP